MNNKSGFSALPAGNRGTDGTFFRNDGGYWWSTTENDASYAYYHCLFWFINYFNRDDLQAESEGISVRLVRDN
jgi:uncharacterized protein (TIGR02145 family)